MCIVECIVGSRALYFTCKSMAFSLRSLKKSAFQYHCKPAGYKASNRLCKTGHGIGPAKSTAGVRKARMGFNSSSARSIGAVEHHTMAHIFCRCNCSGKGGAGGTVIKANQPLISSGACKMKSRQNFITYAAC